MFIRLAQDAGILLQFQSLDWFWKECTRRFAGNVRFYLSGIGRWKWAEAEQWRDWRTADIQGAARGILVWVYHLITSGIMLMSRYLVIFIGSERSLVSGSGEPQFWLSVWRVVEWCFKASNPRVDLLIRSFLKHHENIPKLEVKPVKPSWNLNTSFRIFLFR